MPGMVPPTQKMTIRTFLHTEGTMTSPQTQVPLLRVINVLAIISTGAIERHPPVLKGHVDNSAPRLGIYFTTGC